MTRTLSEVRELANELHSHHSPTHRDCYACDLSRELIRLLPVVEAAERFLEGAGFVGEPNHTALGRAFRRWRDATPDERGGAK